jgi:hypothetical protein
VTDLSTQIKPILENFYSDEKLRTCGTCGKTLPPPVTAGKG